MPAMAVRSGAILFCRVGVAVRAAGAPAPTRGCASILLSPAHIGRYKHAYSNQPNRP